MEKGLKSNTYRGRAALGWREAVRGCQCCSPEMEVTPEEEVVHLKIPRHSLRRKEGRKEDFFLLDFLLVEVSRSGTENRIGSGFVMHSRDRGGRLERDPKEEEYLRGCGLLAGFTAAADEGCLPLLGFQQQCVHDHHHQ